MSDINFKDFSIEVKAAMSDAVAAFLEEAAAEVQAQVQRNTAVDTGQLKGSWAHVVDNDAHEAIIGSPLENAIWEEFGTGEYALEGNGRKGGWYYRDKKGRLVFTYGKKPKRALHRAFEEKKSQVIKMAEEALRGLK